MSNLVAYHGDLSIKRKYLARVRAHVKADELIKGRYWKDGKGCAIGCTIHGSNHHDYEKELGIPEAIARLEDLLFEGLDNETAQAWPERFLKAIKPGADLSLVIPRFLYWLLVDPKAGVIRFAGDYKDVRIAIKKVAELYKRVIKGKVVTNRDWSVAQEGAWAAADAAVARAEMEAAEWERAAEAAEVAAWAGAEAAVAAERAAWAAGAAQYIYMADKLIELLEEA